MSPARTTDVTRRFSLSLGSLRAQREPFVAGGEGRLTLEEYSERVCLAQAARTDQELARLARDLPGDRAAATPPAAVSDEHRGGFHSPVIASGRRDLAPLPRVAGLATGVPPATRARVGLDDADGHVPGSVEQPVELVIELDERYRGARHVQRRACTPPAKGSPLFELGEDEMELG